MPEQGVSQMVTISVDVLAYRKLIAKGKLGAVPANGVRIDGREIASFIFERHAMVRYIWADGTCDHVFQDKMYLDD
jgi:hypothetical protein